MSVQHMPTPPDRPTNQASPPGVETQPSTAPADPTQAQQPAPTTPGEPRTEGQAQATQAQPAPAPEQTAPSEPAPLPLNEDMARILEEQVDLIVQRQVYHSQMMVGVSALGNDPVSSRNAVLTVAKALRSKSSAGVEYALVNLGDPQIPQINDHTLPFKFNAQVAGLLEGLMIDAIRQVYRSDPARAEEARSALEAMFLEANEQAERQHKAQLAFLAPGPHPNARQ